MNASYLWSQVWKGSRLSLRWLPDGRTVGLDGRKGPGLSEIPRLKGAGGKAASERIRMVYQSPDLLKKELLA